MVAMLSFAHDFEVDGIYYNITSSSEPYEVAVTYRGTSNSSYDEYKGVVTIPAAITYNSTTYSVTTIGQGAFGYCKNLTSVEISNSVTSIGNEAFCSCSNLTSVVIPNSVTSIGNEVFYSCSNLTSVVIPNSVKSIGSSAFKGCTGLTTIEIPESVTTMNSSGSGVFYRCTGLTSITINSSALLSKNYTASNNLCDVFGVSSNQKLEIIIGNAVTSIGKYAFSGWRGLTSVTIPNNVTSIGTRAFEGCSGLTAITIPTSVTTIGEGAFSGCSGLTAISIPNSVTTIEKESFARCSGLIAIIIPEGVTTIEEKAFYSCSNLTSVVIPSSVTYILSSTFEYCGNLSSVTINSNELVSKDYTSGSNLRDILSGQTVIIGNGVTKIGKYAFSGWSNLTSVEIPNSVTSIGNYAFSGCTGLASVEIPNSVTSIGEYTFSSCTGLTSVEIPNSVTTIGNSAFRNCTGLTSIAIPSSVMTIGDGAFYGCTGLTSLEIPNSVTDIGSNAFRNCSSLNVITISKGVTSIGSSAFFGCTGLASVEIPNSVTTIGDGAFSGCTGLTSVEIPSSVTNIGSKAFYNCTGLTSVTINSDALVSKDYTSNSTLGGIFGVNQGLTSSVKLIIGNGVTSIGKYAFYRWYGLTSVEMSNSVTSIGEYTFSSCTGLTSVEIPNSVTSIGNSAFEYCTGLTSIAIPSSVTTIGDGAFVDCSNLTKVIVKDIAAWCNVTFGSGSTSNPLYYAHRLYSDENTEITDLVIPEGVTNVRNFSYCTNFTSVTLPASVTTIGRDEFKSCTNLTAINIPRGTSDLYKSLRLPDKCHIYEKENNVVWADIIVGAPTEFSTYYDADSDGVMEYLSWNQEYKNSQYYYHYGFYDKEGNKKIEMPDCNSGSYSSTPKNGNGDLLMYSKGSRYVTVDGVGKEFSLLVDVDNDGRKDLVTRYQSDDKFTIHYQQSDGSFKAIEQSAVMDEEATKAAANKGGGGIVSFADGMMVKAPKHKPSSSNRAVEFAGGSSIEIGACTAVDMNDDGILDLMNNGEPVLYSYDDNRFFIGTRNRSLHPCDLDGDGELDYVCYDGSNIILQVRESGTEFTEKTLFTNSNVKQIIYKDFDHDGDIDILAYINDAKSTSAESGNTYFVFFRNDGDLSFKRRERNFAVNYNLLDIKDVDADGLYEMIVNDYTNKVKKLLNISEDLTVTESDYDFSDATYNGGIRNMAIGDFDSDGKVEYRYIKYYDSSSYSTDPAKTKYGIFSNAVNSAPTKMEAPTAVLDAGAQRLRINWKQGTDKETSSCDLTYELRIGTESASGNVLFGASLADGTRRTLEDGNMGRSLSTLFNAKSLKPGKYYISVQAVDAGGRGGAWSDDFVYEHQLAAPVIVSNVIDKMTAADTLRLSVKAPIEGAEYKWTVSEGRQIESDGLDTRFVFEHDGEHTVNLAMTYDGRTLNAEPLIIPTVEPAKYTWYNGKSEPGYVDLNQDGYPEYLGYVNDGEGNMEKVLLSYVTNIPGENGKHYFDYNLDGYVDAVVKNNVYISLGEQDNDFDMFNQTFTWKYEPGWSYSYSYLRGTTYFDANNDGYLDSSNYNDGTNIVWSPYCFMDEKYRLYDEDTKSLVNSYINGYGYDIGKPNFDVNRDGFMDIVKQVGNKWYVMYKDSTANISYSNPQVLFEIPQNLSVGYWVLEDVNNDGCVDLIGGASKNLLIVKGTSKTPCTETVLYELPQSISGISDCHDYNNDGYVDVVYNGGNYLITFGAEYSLEVLKMTSDYNSRYNFLVQKDGGYPDGNLSHIKNQSPSAPASVAAKQTKDGMLITWSDAQDDHTPAMQMRYNISVKRKGKKGDNSFVISPMNGLKDKATICGTVMYKKSTQMLVPSSVLTAGETYEIQVQAIDLWNQHSPMTKAIEFTMTSNGYIDVAEQVATDKETTVKFVGSQAGSYSLNAGDGATIVSDKGNGEYIVKWATEGVKDIALTAGNTTVKSSVTVVKPIDLTFTVPATVFAKAPLTIEVSDEMAKAAKNVGLRCNDVNVKIEYVVGSKTANVTFPATGTYTLEAYSTDEVKGNTYSQVVNVIAVMPHAVIKQVDADAATGSYAISWNADALPTGISKMIISKEGSKLGQFDKIETVAATAGRYVDLSSNASVMASRYCIQLVAENGQMSEVSVAHKPLHVMITNAAQGFNLIWDSYEGLNVESYNILRGSTPDNLQEIAQVAGSVNSYTDISAPSGVSYYAVTFTTTQPQLSRGQKRTKVADETVNSNVISTENAIDAVVAERLEIIVLDEEKELTDEHTDLQLYYMILPTYTTVNKVTWEIVEGKDIATIDANGKLHATGGEGTVVVRVKTVDGSDLTDEISINCMVMNQGSDIRKITSASDTNATLKETRFYTIDGKRLDSPINGQMYIEWSIYSNGQIVVRKLFNKQ